MLWTLLAACSGGVTLDDTAAVEDSAATDDTQDTEDQDFAHAGTWSGDIDIQAVDLGELCDGTFELEIDDAGDAQGEGACTLAVGPGAGEVLLVELSGAVDDDGAWSGSAVWLFGPPDDQRELQADVDGQIDGDDLSAAFEAQQAGPDGGEAITLVGALDGSRE